MDSSLNSQTIEARNLRRVSVGAFLNAGSIGSNAVQGVLNRCGVNNHSDWSDGGLEWSDWDNWTDGAEHTDSDSD